MKPAFDPLHPTEHVSFAFDAESEAAIAKILAKYPEGRKASAVVPLLDLAQRQMKRNTGSAWVPCAAMDTIAERLGMAKIRVYEVATFYSMFNLKPVGRWHLQVCTTTPCWLRGSDEVVAACKKVTGITHFGGTSEDGLFTLSEVECLGACVNAPILQINDDFYEDMDGKAAERILEALKRGEPPPPPGSVIGRRASEPWPEETQATANAADGSAEHAE